MTMFKVQKGKKACEILKYDYKYLVKIAEFPDFEVWKTDSSNVSSDSVITEDELKELLEQQEQVIL